MTHTLHALLRRQLKRLGIVLEGSPPAPPGAEAWAGLLERVSKAYDENDQERYLLERSQALAGEETALLYAELRRERDLLEARVKERTEALRLSESRLSSLLTLSADWVWEQDAELRLTYLSDGLTKALGIDVSQLLGRQGWSGDFSSAPEDWIQLLGCLQARQPFRDALLEYKPPGGGQTRYLTVSGEPVFDGEGRFAGYRGVGSDITQRKLAEHQVHRLARHDNLTGLPNRTLFLEELDRALSRSARSGEPFAVCFIDLDRFKAVNDSLGHAAGDELLKTMAHRLRGTLRATDTVARLGGDEFVLLLERCGEPAEVQHLMDKVLATIGQPLLIQGTSFLVTGSVGVARHPADSDDASELLKHADAAMYLAKERGKNMVQFYSSQLAELAAQSFELESALRLALVREELVLHYQPKLDVASGELVGMEALVRWHHPLRGMVPPGDFISLAEERGLIVPLGRWVMRAACRQVRAWRDAGLQVPPVAINLSARQFADEALLGSLRETLDEYGLAPQDFDMELTESVLMADPERANEVLQAMVSLGLKISIDDFGTGYSSLSYLKRFPAHTVKIDRSFIGGLPGDQDDTAITQAVIAMAHSLGLSVVAEGVETQAQWAALKAMRCDQAQGYLLGKPMPAEALAHRLAAQRPLVLLKA
ncbi:MAG: EAL domain-containing protein [Rubrivivax sp.]|nr:EAL domain-containing protein [Rubrivivax sp.]